MNPTIILNEIKKPTFKNVNNVFTQAAKMSQCLDNDHVSFTDNPNPIIESIK